MDKKEKKLKVGILTLHYLNYNCGGLLQSYATQRVLEKLGYESKQICLHRTTRFHEKSLKEKIRGCIKDEGFLWCLKIPYRIIRKIYGKCKKQLAEKLFLTSFVEKQKLLHQDMKRFMDYIPHTERVYRYSDISDVAEKFDIFVCGSDQVWNPRLADLNVFTFGFVHGNQGKIAYAPSIANDHLTEDEKDILCKNLKSFRGVSLREDFYQEFLSEKLGRRVPVVLDPTLLLKREEWDELLETYPFGKGERDDCDIREPYLFAYLLGNCSRNRKKIQRYARSRHLKIVYCPYLLGSASKHLDDRGFGDYRINHLSPAVFLKLIENAECVATDSFHACVFSVLFHTEFTVLDREIKRTKSSMFSRLDTLLKEFDIKEKYCGVSEEIGKGKTDWEKVDSLLEEQRKNSLGYLRNALIG